MFKLEDYTKLLKFLEDTVIFADPITANNLARELSVIYVKATFSEFNPSIIERLRSMMVYIKKTIPDYSEELCEILNDVIHKMENRA